MTDYLYESWYMAGWSDDLGATPIRRVILEQPVALFRLADGTPVALADRCPHRLVPLSRGSVVGDVLQCGYHGLQFDRSGACAFNPHADEKIPPAAVRAYPLVEKYGATWIWMGRPETATPASIPDFPSFDDTARFQIASGLLPVKANYQLVADNLLDLSHVEYLHPALKTRGTTVRRFDVRQDGDTVWSLSWRYGGLPNLPMQRFWPADKPGDLHSHMRWDPPALIFFDVGMGEVGRPDAEARSLLSVHLLTPETATSTHYFWGFLCAANAPEEVAALRAFANQAFEKEDIPMIEAQQRNIDEADAATLDRGLISFDSAAIRARRVLRGRIERQSAGRAEELIRS